MTKVYENSFDWNEWFVIIVFISLHLLVWLAPKIFKWIDGIAYYLYGIGVVTFWDHTLSVRPWDLYDVNDNSKFQLIDFTYYVMNGPYSYFFIYFYVKLKIKGYTNILYLLIWSSFALFLEWVGVKLGMFHYDKGYKMYWSFPIYLFVQMVLIIYFHVIQRKNQTG
jgi:hypothetical protein